MDFVWYHSLGIFDYLMEECLDDNLHLEVCIPYILGEKLYSRGKTSKLYFSCSLEVMRRLSGAPCAFHYTPDSPNKLVFHFHVQL